MTFYIRKAFTLGPVRFNLSKSGVGTSIGVRGLRLGAGPAGTYVHMGRHGLYYRKFFTGPPDSSRRAFGGKTGDPSDSDKFIEFNSGCVRDMRDSSSDALLAEFRDKRLAQRWLPLVLGAGAVLAGILVSSSAPPWTYLSAAPLLAAGSFFAHSRDRIRKTVLLCYEMDGEAERLYQSLHDSFDVLQHCSTVWHVNAVAETSDLKRNAGSKWLLKRRRIQLRMTDGPPGMETNISIPTIPVGRETLFFLPDRVLIVTRRGVGAVPYSDLVVERTQGPFVEFEPLPGDAEVVRWTWRYVNKSGGPDRRFNNNTRLPVALYEFVRFRSGTGLNEVIQLSKSCVAAQFEAALVNLGEVPKTVN